MRILLDTHILIYAMVDDPRLSEVSRRLIVDPKNEAYLSLASVWEIAIKVSIGKLRLGTYWSRSISDWIGRNQVQLLPIEWSHLTRVAGLAFHHSDPFDRLLVAQAIEEKLVLVSQDLRMADYRAV